MVNSRSLSIGESSPIRMARRSPSVSSEGLVTVNSWSSSVCVEGRAR